MKRLNVTILLGTESDRTDYLCSGQQRGLVFTSKSNQITIYFSSESHDYLNAKGFWIQYEGTRTLVPWLSANVSPSMKNPIN